MSCAMRFSALAAIALLVSGPALAQSTPNFSYGQVPTAGQWNAAFATKQDRLTFTPLNQAGGTMQGKLQTAPSTINRAGFSLLPGIAPSSPSEGDLWIAGGNLYARINGQNIQFGLTGSPTFSGTTTTQKLVVTGSGSTGDFSLGSVTPTGTSSPGTLADLIVSKAPIANPVFSGSTLVTPGTITPQAIYTSAFPGVTFSDTSEAVLDVAPGDQRLNLSALAGYVRTRSGGAGTLGKGNAVALFGNGQIAADSSAAWGINTLLTDNTSRAVSSGSGRIATGAELDFNIMSPGTQVIGVSVGGNSLSQPTNANAFLVNSLGTGIKWGAGFWSLDGAAQYALVAGPLATSGSSVASQPILLQYLDGSGAKQTTQMQATGGFAVVSGAPNGLRVLYGSVGLDPGYALTVGGVQVVGARQTGWTAGTGTPNRAAYNADTTQTISATYSQTQVQNLQNQLLATQQRLLALETDLRAHGLIGN